MLRGAKVETITAEERQHPMFTAVGCIRLLEMRRRDPALFSTLDNLNRKLDRVKEDPAASANLAEVKEILLKLDTDYSECDIEECYSLIKLYGYTLPDVEDSKVSFDCLGNCLQNMSFLKYMFYNFSGQINLSSSVTNCPLLPTKPTIHRERGRKKNSSAGHHQNRGRRQAECEIHPLPAGQTLPEEVVAGAEVHRVQLCQVCGCYRAGDIHKVRS